MVSNGSLCSFCFHYISCSDYHLIILFITFYTTDYVVVLLLIIKGSFTITKIRFPVLIYVGLSQWRHLNLDWGWMTFIYWEIKQKSNIFQIYVRFGVFTNSINNVQPDIQWQNAIINLPHRWSSNLGLVKKFIPI